VIIKQLTGYEYDQVWGGDATRQTVGSAHLSPVK